MCVKKWPKTAEPEHRESCWDSHREAQGRVRAFEFYSSFYLWPEIIIFFSSFLFYPIRLAYSNSINSTITEGIRGWSERAGELHQLGVDGGVRERNPGQEARHLCIHQCIKWAFTAEAGDRNHRGWGYYFRHALPVPDFIAHGTTISQSSHLHCPPTDHPHPLQATYEQSWSRGRRQSPNYPTPHGQLHASSGLLLVCYLVNSDSMSALSSPQ